MALCSTCMLCPFFPRLATGRQCHGCHVGYRKCLRAYTARQHVALQGLPVSSFIMLNNSNRSSAPLKKKRNNNDKKDYHVFVA